MPSRTLVAALAAEAIGTFLFFLVGAGAVIMDAQTGGAVGLIGIALAHGLALAALGTAFAPISGGQFNPVVTVALWLVGKVRTIEGIRYIAAQLLGAVAAGFALKLAFGGFEPGDTVWSFARGGAPFVADGLTQVTVRPGQRAGSVATGRSRTRGTPRSAPTCCAGPARPGGC